MNISKDKKIPTIPVMIDDVKDSADFHMSRCTYFSIASNLPSAEVSLDPRMKIPSFMIGFTGVICRPSYRSVLFDKPKKISGLFERVERNENLYVDINDIWLPNYVFDDKNRKRSSVYRIGPELFKLAFNYQNEIISDKDFLKICKERNLKAEFSPEETESFKIWGQKQIKHARKYYKKNPSQWLKTPDKLKEAMK